MPAGTWNLSRLRKRVDYVGLRDLGIERIDRQPTSDRIFNVVDFPSVLTGGKNLFKLRADANTLVKDSKIHIEVLDSNGDPIYYEPINYIEADGTRVIAIYVYPDTPFGTATVYLAGRLQRDLDTGRFLRFSKDVNDPDYLNFPNVLWQRTVTVAPERLNSTEIIFTKKPKVTVQEVVHQYLEPVNLTNVATSSNGSGTFTIKAKPLSITSPSSPTTPVVQSAFTGKSPPAYYGKQVSINPTSLAVSKSPVTGPLGPTSVTTAGIITALHESVFETSVPFFTTDMTTGDVITVVNPLIEVPANTVGNAAGQALPSTQAGFQSGISGDGTAILGTDNGGGGGTLSGIVPLSGSFRFVIDQVLTSKKAEVVLIDGFANEIDSATGGRFGVNVRRKFPEFFAEQGMDDTNVEILNTEPSTNYTCSFTLPFVYSETEQSQSFAEIKIGDIEPATGDVYKVKTMYKAGGGFGDFIDAGDTVLEQLEVLEDTTTFEGDVVDGAKYNRIGFFTSLDDFDTYWTTTAYSSTTGYVSTNNSYDLDILMAAVEIEPSSNFGTNEFSALQLKSEYLPTLTSETNYLLSFNISADNSITTSDPNIGIRPRLDVYISGSNIQTDDLTRNNYIKSDFNEYEQGLTGIFADDATFGTRIGSIELDSGAIIQPAFFRFRHNGVADINGNIVFVIRNGKFDIANIGLRTFNETAYTPNFVRINTRIPTQFLKTPLTFKLEFYDYLNNRADAESRIYPVTFTGENTVVGGESNLFTGSIYIGNAVGAGIELAGVNSAFIRSIGYEGFISASKPEEPGGFLLYTGSILPTSTDNYAGVGIELVEHSESFLRFATAENVSGKPAGLEIRTPRFFLGSANQFISGADGNIEISSSNFHLSNAGDVVMQGSITAEAGGTIGGWIINDNDLVSNNNTVKLDSNGPYYISSSGFQIDTDGAITASSGKIGGFVIGASSLTANNFSLDTSGRRITLGASDDIFIADADEGMQLGHATFASAPFSVDLQGNMSASAGNIAGWRIGSGELASSNNKVRITAAGSITVGEDGVTDRVKMFYGASDDFGINAIDGGNTVFQLGSTNQIAGWKFDSSKIISNNGVNSQASPGIVINSNGTIETDPFISGLTANATGWQIRSDGRAEFENAVIRGTLSTAVFEKDTVSVVGGQVMVANAAKLDKPEERFKDYPMVKSATGEDLNLSGETLPSTASAAGFGIFTSTANAATFYMSTGETVTADNVLDGDLWYKLSRNTSNDNFAITVNGSDVAGKHVRVTMYTSGSSPWVTFVTGSSITNGIAASSYAGTGDGAIVSTQYNRLAQSSDAGTLFHTLTYDVPASTADTCRLAFLNQFTQPWYIRDIHVMVASQSLTVDNAGGFVNGEILVAKSTDQGPDGREGFVREYLRVLETDLGSSETPASGTFDFGSITIDASTDVFVTASKFYTFSGTTTNEVDSIANNQYYFDVGSTKVESLGNLKSKINAEVQDVFVNTTGSAAGIIDQLYMQAVGQGLDGNSYGIQVGSTQVQLQGAQARVKPTLTVERNLDARVEGNERGFFIGKMKDGQSMASQGSDGTGYILLNAQPTDTNTPYIDIVERDGNGVGNQQHTGDDADSVFGTVNTLVRLGDLSGITDNNFSDGVSGYGIYTANGYFKGKIEVASQPEVPSTEHVIAHYPLDSFLINDSGEYYLADLSSNKHDASGSLTATAAIVSGSGMGPSGFAVDATEVGGNLGVVINDVTSSFVSGMDLSFSIWASGSSGTIIEAIDDIVQFSINYPEVLFKLEYISDTVVQLSYPENASISTPAFEQYFATAVYTVDWPIDQWNHYILILDHGGTPSLYVNGIKRTPTTALDPVDFTAANLTNRVQIARDFSGMVTNAKFYDIALTEKNAEAVYLGPNAPSGRTTIEGDRLTTGKIRSNNWGPSFGSRFDLDAGTFQLGGSDNPSFEWDGSNLSVSGSSVTLEVPTFFLGSSTQFVSGSNGNIQIESTNFKVKANGDVTASNALIDGNALITGNATASGILITGDATASGILITGDAKIAEDVTVEGSLSVGSRLNLPSNSDKIIHWGSSAYADDPDGPVSINGDTSTVNVFTSYGTAITLSTASLAAPHPFPTVSKFSGTENATHYLRYDIPANTVGETMTYSVWAKNDGTESDGVNGSEFIFTFLGSDPDANPDGSSTPDGTDGVGQDGGGTGPGLYFSSNEVIWNTGDGSYNPFTTIEGPLNVVDGGTVLDIKNPTIRPNKWHHYVVVNDQASQTASLFIDGIKRGHAAYRNPKNTSAKQLYIGGYTNVNYTWTGHIADFRMYTGSLSQVEINGLFQIANEKRGTEISGDRISTGKIESNNFSTTAGTQLDLDGAIFKVGGTTGRRIEIDGNNGVTTFFQDSGDDCITLDDDVDGNGRPGINIRNGVLQVSNSIDLDSESANTYVYNSNAGTPFHAAQSPGNRIGLFTAVSDAEVNLNVSNIFSSAVPSKGAANDPNQGGTKIGLAVSAKTTTPVATLGLVPPDYVSSGTITNYNEHVAVGIVSTAESYGSYQAFSFIGVSGSMKNSGKDADLNVDFTSKSSKQLRLMSLHSAGVSIGNSPMLEMIYDSDNSLARNFVEFTHRYQGTDTIRGSIKQSGGNIAFNETSDRRLKTNIKPARSRFKDLLKIQIRDYEWKQCGSHGTGVIAQELQELFPEYVTGDETLQVNYSGLIPSMIQAIQEQQTIIEKLESRIRQIEENI